MNGIFNQTISMLERHLDLRSIKHKLVTSNVANMDTPNYKAFNIMVEEELEKSMKSQNQPIPKKSNPRHFPLDGVHSSMHLSVQAVKEDPYSLKGDGNTVDIDKAMTDMAENSIMYNAGAKILAKKFQGIKNVIRGGDK